MKILVTGGAGYVGSAVVERLLSEGHDVVVFDNLWKGHADSVLAAAVLIQGDLLDEKALSDVFKNHQIDTVIHMAAHSEVGPSHASPNRYWHNNVEGGVCLLEAMRQANVRNFVFSSSAAVYGSATALSPIDEKQATAPDSPYAETKLVFEKILKLHSAEVRHVSLRYFNAAGATKICRERHDPETHLIPLLLEVAAGRRNGISVFGSDYNTHDGTAVRDYVHVADLAKAHTLAVTALRQGRTIPTVLNLGSGKGHTVLQVIDTVQRITKRKITHYLDHRRAGDAASLVASYKLAKETLGWQPEHDLDAIVESAA